PHAKTTLTHQTLGHPRSLTHTDNSAITPRLLDHLVGAGDRRRRMEIPKLPRHVPRLGRIAIWLALIAIGWPRRAHETRARAPFLFSSVLIHFALERGYVVE